MWDEIELDWVLGLGLELELGSGFGFGLGLEFKLDLVRLGWKTLIFQVGV